MKKQLPLILFILTLFLPELSQTITVTKPHNGAVWERTVQHTIRWIVEGRMNNKVKIRLYHWEGRTKIKDIVNNTGNNGSFRCPLTIFNDVRDGEYIIRVRTIDNNYFGDSKIFTIENLPADETNNPNTPLPLLGSLKKNLSGAKKRKINIPPSVIITHPPKDHVWDLRLGDKGIPFPIYIMWKKIGNWEENSRVTIALMRVNVPATLGIAENTVNNGLFRGEIPRMDYGNKLLNPYKIVIHTPDRPYKVYVQSQTFYIRNDVYRLD